MHACTYIYLHTGEIERRRHDSAFTIAFEVNIGVDNLHDAHYNFMDDLSEPFGVG